MEQKKIVTARVKQLATLREERVKNDNVLHLPGTFQFELPDGQRRKYTFKSEDGNELDDMAIIGQMVFDLNTKIGQDNWKTLQALVASKPDIKAMIILDDPEAEADKAIDNTKLMLKVMTIIAEHENDHEFLAKIYRRLVGFANGITPKQVFRGLSEIATREPERFLLSNGKMIYEGGTFETLSLIDRGIEKGFFHRDMQGFVKLRTGEPYAQDIDKAAFRLMDDSNTMEALRYELEDTKQVSPSGYTPHVEMNDDFYNLMNSVGEPVDPTESVQLVGNDDSMRFEQDLAEKLPKLVELAFIEEKQIQGGHKRYTIEGLATKFKMEELSGYFKQNPEHFLDMVSRANI